LIEGDDERELLLLQLHVDNQFQFKVCREKSSSIHHFENVGSFRARVPAGAIKRGETRGQGQVLKMEWSKESAGKLKKLLYTVP
jgi:hypothetical protein